MTQVALPWQWEPRDKQLEAWEYMEGGGRHAELVWHRRYGKDDFGLRWTSVSAFQRVGTYWYMLPMQAQARKAIWLAVNPHTGRRRIDEAFPKALRRTTRDQEMFIEFVNGATWQVLGSDNYDALVGSPPIGVVYSEWALSDPASAAYLQPIFNENGGWQIFNTTPRGKNHAFRTLTAARTNPNKFAQVLTAEDTGVYSTKQLDEMRQDYVDRFGEVLGDAYFQQEYMCSFETPVIGAVYGRELKLAAKRTVNIPYDPTKPVHTFWDLGRADKTAIWFVQLGPFEVRVIDYLEGTGKHISEYLQELQLKKYVYGDMWLPHDSKQQLLAARRTVYQQLIDAGYKAKVVPRTSIEARIEATRLLFPMVWFDAGRTDTGRNALNNYRFDVKADDGDESHWRFSNEPLHDWASHAADAFGYMAVALKSPAKDTTKNTDTRPKNSGGWMNG